MIKRGSRAVVKGRGYTLQDGQEVYGWVGSVMWIFEGAAHLKFRNGETLRIPLEELRDVTKRAKLPGSDKRRKKWKKIT